MKGWAWSDLGLLAAIGARYRTGFCGVVVLSVLASGFDGISIGMLVPLLGSLQRVETAGVTAAPVRWLVAMATMAAPGWRLHLLLGLVVAAVALKSMLTFVSIRWGHRLSSRLVADVRGASVRRVLAAGLAFHDRSKPGDLLDRVCRHSEHLGVLVRLGIEFTANALTLVALVLVLFFLSWRLAALALVMGTGSVLCGLLYGHRLVRLAAEETAAMGDMTALVCETIAAIRLIKSSSTEPRHIGELDGSIGAVSEASFRRTIYSFAIHPITDVTATFALAAIFAVSYWLNGGDVRLMLALTLPFMFVLLRIVPLLKILNGQKAEILGRWPNLHLVAGLLFGDIGPTIKDGDEPFSGLESEIRLEGLTFSYRGRGQAALSSLNLVIPAGKTTAIIGESGSGKSTLASLLLRLYDPDAGVITIDGRPFKNLLLDSYHRHVVGVAQEPFLFHQTIRSNLAYGASCPPSDEALVAAAKQARAHDFIMELPEGYDTVIGDRGVTLSGGQRQRLVLARAILANPDVLVLDEATSALDAETERAILAALKEFGRGRTVIVIAHRPSSIEGADQIVVLKNGRIVDVRRPCRSLV